MKRPHKKSVLSAVVMAVALSASVAGFLMLRPLSPRAAAPEVAVSPPPAVRPEGPPDAIVARGRFEPKDGIMRVAGPSQPTIFTNVLAELRVREGDLVEAGQVLAVFDSYPAKQAAVDRLRAELSQAQREYRRFQQLFHKGVASASERDNWLAKLQVTEAELHHAEADLELARVRAPISGQVLKIHAYAGERVGRDGVAELGKTDEMYAVAEVYENDIVGVRIGQRARVTSSALRDELQGTVEHIGWKIGRMDILDTDPAAKADARVVEVKIRLDDSTRVARLTNMQVDVRILP